MRVRYTGHVGARGEERARERRRRGGGGRGGGGVTDMTLADRGQGNMTEVTFTPPQGATFIH